MMTELDADVIEAVVTERRLEGGTTVILRLEGRPGTPLPKTDPGAHIDLCLSDDVVRPYSLCHDMAEGNSYKLAIALEPQSRGGSLAAHRLRVGDPVRVSHPRNNFRLTPTAGRTILLARGVGITPLLAMSYALARDGADFELHYSVRSLDRVVLTEELSDPAIAPFTHLHTDEAPKGERFAPDRVLADPGPDDHLYICGTESFMGFLSGAAESMGWKPDHIHMEPFSRKVDLSGDPFVVQAVRSGVSVEVPSGESIAKVLERHGVHIRLSCENGLCGSCLVGVLEGTPEHRDRYLSEADRATARDLTTCCSRSRSPVLVLDV